MEDLENTDFRKDEPQTSHECDGSQCLNPYCTKSSILNFANLSGRLDVVLAWLNSCIDSPEDHPEFKTFDFKKELERFQNKADRIKHVYNTMRRLQQGQRMSEEYAKQTLCKGTEDPFLDDSEKDFYMSDMKREIDNLSARDTVLAKQEMEDERRIVRGKRKIGGDAEERTIVCSLCYRLLLVKRVKRRPCGHVTCPSCLHNLGLQEDDSLMCVPCTLN